MARPRRRSGQPDFGDSSKKEMTMKVKNNKENYLVFFFAVVAGYFLSNKAVQIFY